MKYKWGIYWADNNKDDLSDLLINDFRGVDNVGDHVVDFDEVLEWGLIQCDSDSWFCDSYPGTYSRSGYVDGRFVVKNFVTGEEKQFTVMTEFIPSFVITEN